MLKKPLKSRVAFYVFSIDEVYMEYKRENFHYNDLVEEGCNIDEKVRAKTRIRDNNCIR